MPKTDILTWKFNFYRRFSKVKISQQICAFFINKNCNFKYLETFKRRKIFRYKQVSFCLIFSHSFTVVESYYVNVLCKWKWYFYLKKLFVIIKQINLKYQSKSFSPSNCLSLRFSNDQSSIQFWYSFPSDVLAESFQSECQLNEEFTVFSTYIKVEYIKRLSLVIAI